MTKITKLYYGGIHANAYVVGEEGGPCFVVDFGYNRGHALEHYLSRHHSECLGVLLTHGHFDHIAGLCELENPRFAPIYIGREDERCLFDADYNVSKLVEESPMALEENTMDIRLLDDGDAIELGPWTIRVIATPFHTAGSVCYLLEGEDVLFSGDTLFRFGIGRSDLKGSVPRLQSASLAKLKTLKPETRVYPGHGPMTSIADERKYNDAF